MDEPSPHANLKPTPLYTSVVGSQVLVFDVVDSTNDVALRRGGDGLVVIADAQTAGRGRHGRSWHSLPGKGLWFSVAFEEHVEGLAFAAALAVRDAAREWRLLEIEWPNDLLCCGKKVCGILVERRKGRTAIGIGINVNHREEDFPEELRTTATSIELASGKPCDRTDLLRGVLTRFDDRVLALRSGRIESVRREWVSLCHAEGWRVRCGPIEGVVETIDETGALVVATENGPQRIVFGEIVERTDT